MVEPLTLPGADLRAYVPEPTGLLRYGIEVAGHRLLVDPSRPCQVLDLQVVYPLPNSAHWFLGLSNVQGGVVPVFDLAQTLGAPATAGDAVKLLVIGARGRSAGILIQSLPTKLTLDAEERVPPASHRTRSRRTSSPPTGTWA